MKKRITLVCALCAVFFLAQAGEKKKKEVELDFTLEAQVYCDKETVHPLGSAEIFSYFNHKKWGLYIYNLISPKWGEIIAGPAFHIETKNAKNVFETSCGLGVESAYIPIRGLGLFKLTHFKNEEQNQKGSLILFAVGEYGGSGYYYSTYLNYNISKWFGVGYLGQFDGVWGPRVEFNFPHGKIWTAGGINIEAEPKEEIHPKKTMGWVGALQLNF